MLSSIKSFFFMKKLLYTLLKQFFQTMTLVSFIIKKIWFSKILPAFAYFESLSLRNWALRVKLLNYWIWLLNLVIEFDYWIWLLNLVIEFGLWFKDLIIFCKIVFLNMKRLIYWLVLTFSIAVFIHILNWLWSIQKSSISIDPEL